MTDYVSLQDVTKTYRMGEITIKAADGISFDVQKGDLYFANRWKGAILEKISSFERVL